MYIRFNHRESRILRESIAARILQVNSLLDGWKKELDASYCQGQNREVTETLINSYTGDLETLNALEATILESHNVPISKQLEADLIFEVEKS
jgi:hypothetical protein